MVGLGVIDEGFCLVQIMQAKVQITVSPGKNFKRKIQYFLRNLGVLIRMWAPNTGEAWYQAQLGVVGIRLRSEILG